MARLKPNEPCPCGHHRKYKKCCGVFHRGRAAETPEQLMRSRYAAYVTGQADYIMATTDPDGPLWVADADSWRADILRYCRLVEFVGLEVLAARHAGDEGTVSFAVRMTQGGAPADFAEDSRFVRKSGRWLYHSGRSLTGNS